MIKKLSQKGAIAYIGIILMLCTFLSPLVYAEIPNATNDFYVNDFANVFTSEQRNELVNKADTFAQKHDGVQIVITTVENLDDMSIEEYANKMYNTYGIGKNNMGVLILLSTGERKIRVEIGREMEAYLTDSKAGNLIDNYAIPYLRDNRFADGLILLQDKIFEELANKFENEGKNSNTVSSTVEVVSSSNDSPVNNISGKNKEKTRVSIVASVFITLVGCFGIGVAIFILVKYSTYDREIRAKCSELEATNKSLKKDVSNSQAHNFDQVNQHTKEKNRMLDEIQLLKKMIEGETARASKLDEQRAYFEKSCDELFKENCDFRTFFDYAKELHPNLEQEVKELVDKKQEEKAKSDANEFDSFVKEHVVNVPVEAYNVDIFENAMGRFNSLTDQAKSFVTVDVSQIKAKLADSKQARIEYEEAQKRKRNEKTAAKIIATITAFTGALALGKARDLQTLRNLQNQYNRLDPDIKKLCDAKEIDKLNRLIADAEQDEEEEKARKRREAEERRKRERREREEREEEEQRERQRRREREEEERRRRSSDSSFGSSSHHSGFGGSSRGGGASRGF